MDDEVSEFWQQQKEEQWERRVARLPIRTERILELRKEGFHVEQKTPYHFRVNRRLDVWPIHNRWHDTKRNKRGGAKDLAEFIRRFFAAVDPSERFKRAGG